MPLAMLFIGAIAAGCGWLLDWMAYSSDRVPAIWLLIEELSGTHGFRDWMTMFGALAASVGAHEIALHRRGRVLRRIPQLLAAGVFAWGAWHEWTVESRYVLAIVCGLLGVAQLLDPQKGNLPEAKVVDDGK